VSENLSLRSRLIKDRNFIPSFDIDLNRSCCMCTSCKRIVPNLMSFKDSIIGVFVCTHCMRKVTHNNGHDLCMFESNITYAEKLKMKSVLCLLG